jgi:DNA-binding IscR family transcriptional regulator
MEVMCSLKTTWQEVRDATIAILERTNFADLAARAGGPWRAHLPASEPAVTAATRGRARKPRT